MKIRSSLTLIAGAAALMSSALAQSIPAPASSVDSSARATVAINLANYATQTQVTNVQNTATAALSTAQTASGSSLPWPRLFAGQWRNAGCSSGWVCRSAYIDGNGYVYVVHVDGWGNLNQWRPVGYTSGGQRLQGVLYGTAAGWGSMNVYYNIYPTAFDVNGRATNWAASIQLESCDAAGCTAV